MSEFAHPPGPARRRKIANYELKESESEPPVFFNLDYLTVHNGPVEKRPRRSSAADIPKASTSFAQSYEQSI